MIYTFSGHSFRKQNENNIKHNGVLKIFFQLISLNSRSAAILVNDSCEFEVLNVKQDEDGNYIVLDVKIEDYPFLLINIYDISNDTPFFSQF